MIDRLSTHRQPNIVTSSTSYQMSRTEFESLGLPLENEQNRVFKLKTETVSFTGAESNNLQNLTTRDIVRALVNCVKLYA